MIEGRQAEFRRAPVRAEDLRLGFFGRSLTVRSDLSDVLAYCRSLFSRFVIPDPDRAPGDRAMLEILGHPAGGWRIRDRWLDAVVDDRGWLEGIAVARILESVGNEVDDHDLIHGAALARRDRALAIVGESGFGKSTLTLALLARGWRLLSDEIVAFRGDEPRVVPFPKAIEAGREAFRLAGLEPPASVGRRGKLWVDPDAIPGSGLSSTSAAAAIVFLGDARAPAAHGRGGRTLRMTVHRRGEGVVEALRRHPGVVGAEWARGIAGLPGLVVRLAPGGSDAWRLDEVLGRVGVLIVDSSAEEDPPRDFRRLPDLRRIPTDHGVGELLARFRGRRAFSQHVEAAGDFASLFVDWMERFRAVPFYRLDVGRLDRSIELLEGVIP